MPLCFLQLLNSLCLQQPNPDPSHSSLPQLSPGAPVLPNPGNNPQNFSTAWSEPVSVPQLLLSQNWEHLSHCITFQLRIQVARGRETEIKCEREDQRTSLKIHTKSQGEKNFQMGKLDAIIEWLQLRTADISGVQRTPKTSKQQPGQHGKALERSSLFLLLFSSSSCILELIWFLKGRMLQILPGEPCIPSWEQGKGTPWASTQIHVVVTATHTGSWSPSDKTTPLLIFLHKMQRSEFPSPRAWAWLNFWSSALVSWMKMKKEEI